MALKLRAALLTLLTPLLASADTPRADAILPPWTDVGDVPIPAWAKSVTPNRSESAIYAEPGKIELRRGSAQPGARLPLFGTRRGGGCQGRWLNVGPLAWMCSDVGDYSAEDPTSPALGTHAWIVGNEDQSRPSRPGAHASLPPIDPQSGTDDGLPYRYFFAGRDGAYGFANLASALDDAPDQELEAGFAVAILEEKSAHGERWGRTKKGRWVAMRELTPARANLFHGELLRNAATGTDAPLDVAWVVVEKANTFTSEKTDKASGSRVRFEMVHAFETKVIDKVNAAIRITADGVTPAVWMRSRDISRARLVDPPPEVKGVDANERWIDVDLNQQTLVAYEGKKPVFATIVSTGKGALGSEFVTRTGTFRIWVKVFTTKMDNLDKDEVDRHYAIEDVPWVQFFDKAIALHGAFWHRDFGHVHSHGCVNMSPLDARWVFAFTSPHLPLGWNAVLPSKIEQGAVVRVH